MLNMLIRGVFRNGAQRRLNDAIAPPQPNEALLAAAPIHIFAEDGLVQLEDGHLTIRRRDEQPIRLRLEEIAQVSIHGEAELRPPACGLSSSGESL